MRSIFIEIRKLISSYVVRILHWILPDGEFKREYNKFIINNIMKL